MEQVLKRTKRGKKHRNKNRFIFVRGIIRCKNAVIRSPNAVQFAYVDRSVRRAKMPIKHNKGIIQQAKQNITKRLECQTYISVFFLLNMLIVSDEKNSETLYDKLSPFPYSCPSLASLMAQPPLSMESSSAAAYDIIM